jgi:hypothetical protein
MIIHILLPEMLAWKRNSERKFFEANNFAV